MKWRDFRAWMNEYFDDEDDEKIENFYAVYVWNPLSYITDYLD